MSVLIGGTQLLEEISLLVITAQPKFQKSPLPVTELIKSAIRILIVQAAFPQTLKSGVDPGDDALRIMGNGAPTVVPVSNQDK
ncbi:hypothetical protein BIS06_04800 [Halomonas sp. BBD48]|nr:hypothetical protein [Halomonas sp. BBD48]